MNVKYCIAGRGAMCSGNPEINVTGMIITFISKRITKGTISDEIAYP